MERTIIIDENLYPPRRNWRFCHELAHILLGHTKSEVITREMEWEADRYAGELMLPSEQFREDMASLDLSGLKVKYNHASWEAIARRWSQLKPAVLTIFDNEKQTCRIAPENLVCPPIPTQPELEAIREAYRIKQTVRRSASEDVSLFMQAYFIDEGRGVERVLLLTEVVE